MNPYPSNISRMGREAPCKTNEAKIIRIIIINESVKRYVKVYMHRNDCFALVNA